MLLRLLNGSDTGFSLSHIQKRRRERERETNIGTLPPPYYLQEIVMTSRKKDGSFSNFPIPLVFLFAHCFLILHSSYVPTYLLGVCSLLEYSNKKRKIKLQKKHS